jgi:hypothetical protein
MPSSAPRQIRSAECSTFLYAIRRAALEAYPQKRQSFVHAGKLYDLETRRNPEHPHVISAAIRDRGGARPSEFRATYAAGDESGLPVRIEYRAKPFLRLTLEAEPDAIQPPIPFVFEESAQATCFRCARLQTRSTWCHPTFTCNGAKP